MNWEQFPEWQEPQKPVEPPTLVQDTGTKTEDPYKIEWESFPPVNNANFPLAKVQGTSET